MDGHYLRELKRKRGELHAQAQTILDRAKLENQRSLTPSEQANLDRVFAERSTIDATISRAEEHDAVEARLSQSGGRQTDTAILTRSDNESWATNQAIRAWALGNRARPEHIEAANRLGFNYTSPEIETRALSVGTTTAGGNAVSNEMIRSFWEAQKWYGRVRNVATVLRTSTGAPLPIPVTDDTANTGEIIGEASAVTTTADPLFNQTVLHPFKYSSKAVIVSVELLQDAAINIAEYLGRALGERIARIQNLHYTVGAGTTLPFGVATQASLGKTAAVTTAITFDEIADLMAAVDIGYRSRPGFALMMHDGTAALLRKIKDSQNAYLWEHSIVEGTPDRIFGAQVIINNDMDQIGAAAKRVVLAGDFSAYHIQEAADVTLMRSEHVRLLNHQIVFLAFARADGALVDTTAVKYLRTP